MSDSNTVETHHEELAKYAKALSHPIRVYILELLSNQNCCYSGDLSDVLPIAKSTLSQHLKELKNSGLIQGEIEPPKIKYCLNEIVWEKMTGLFESLLQKEQFKTYNSCCNE